MWSSVVSLSPQAKKQLCARLLHSVFVRSSSASGLKPQCKSLVHLSQASIPNLHCCDHTWQGLVLHKMFSPQARDLSDKGRELQKPKAVDAFRCSANQGFRLCTMQVLPSICIGTPSVLLGNKGYGKSRRLCRSILNALHEFVSRPDQVFTTSSTEHMLALFLHMHGYAILVMCLST